MKNYLSRDRLLQSAEYEDKLIVTSEPFYNTWFEIKGRVVILNVLIDNRHIKLPGEFSDMKVLAQELLSVIDVWGEL